MRGRRVITRSGCRPRGSFPSAKNGRMVHFESVLEKHACYLLEFSPGVRSYQEQPLVELPTGERRYPDFEIVDAMGGINYVEVKSRKQLARPEVSERLQCLEEYLNDQGFGYQVLTEADMDQQPRLNNLKLLFAYRTAVATGLDPAVERLLPQEALPYRVVAELIGCATRTLSLLADQHLVFDLQKPFSMDVLVSRPGGAHHETLLF